VLIPFVGVVANVEEACDGSLCGRAVEGLAAQGGDAMNPARYKHDVQICCADENRLRCLWDHRAHVELSPASVGLDAGD